LVAGGQAVVDASQDTRGSGLSRGSVKQSEVLDRGFVTKSLKTP
jgi:hypothetical protein